MANPTPSQRYAAQAQNVAADNRRLTRAGTVLLARFSQIPQTHGSLAGHLLSAESRAMIHALLSMPCTTYVGLPPTPPQTVDQLGALNIRFASFYIRIKTASEPGPIISAYMIPTIPVNGFAVINLFALAASPPGSAANDIYNNCVAPEGVLTVLFRKILYELKVLGYDLNGTGTYNPEMPTSLLINCDIYYNRSSTQAGHFHRDISAPADGTPEAAAVNAVSAATAAAFGLNPDYVAGVVAFGNNPQNVSLEFFSPQIHSPFLGPEVFLHDLLAGENSTVRYSDAVVNAEFLRRNTAAQEAATAPAHIAHAQAVAAANPFDIRAQAAPGQISAALSLVEASARSLRVLVTDGTTVLFNNFAAIHATPITQPYQVLHPDLTPTPGLGNPFETDQNRLEVTAPQHPAVAITRDDPRTFLRIWFAAAPEWFRITEYPNIQIGGLHALAEIAVFPAVDFPELNPSQIYGGSTISSYEDESKKPISTLLKSEYNLKNETINKSEYNNLVNFKISGDPKNPIVKINCDVPFEEINGPENIEKYKDKELEFLKKLVNQKGGKNNRRKHKKTYNRKTKKNRKTNKAKKHRKNTKSKKSKK